MVVRMWVIGGVYRWGCDDVRLDEMFRTEGGKLRAWFREHKPGSSKNILCTDFTGISGPTHVPCPVCALMQQVSTDGLQIDLAEHLMRHHPEEWKKQQDAETPSSVDPGEGWRLLEPNETVQSRDQFKTSVSEHWRVCDFSVGQLVEDCDDNVFRRRVDPTEARWKWPPDPGEGFRLLEPDELIDAGDDIMAESAGEWFPIVEINQSYVGKRADYGLPSLMFRRREEADATPDCSVDPGAGYRLLGKGESLRPRDEFYSSAGCTAGFWYQSEDALKGHPQCRDLTYRRKLTHPSGPGTGFRFVDEIFDTPEPDDEIWSFVTEEWKLTDHADCNEFKGLPVVRQRVVTHEIENKSDVKPEDRKPTRNCVFFEFSGESFCILLTPDGNVSLHRLVPFAGLAMIVERSSFRELRESSRACLLEVLVKAGVRLPVASEIVDADENDFFSLGFVEAAESAWAGVHGPF